MARTAAFISVARPNIRTKWEFIELITILLAHEVPPRSVPVRSESGITVERPPQRRHERHSGAHATPCTSGAEFRPVG